ncbi:GAS2L2, partial [Cervus elaphus hippelaphus]
AEDTVSSYGKQGSGGRAERRAHCPQVQSLVSRCTCPVQFSMVKVSEGKYRVGDSNTLIFIRILRNHVMVREFNPFLLSSLWGAMLVAHKTGSFLQPPAHPAQHEVRVEDGPSQPQPTMTISRSQSPLPPVDWKTYTSSGRKLRPPAASFPRPRHEERAGPGVLRETAPLLRCQEKLFTPSRRQLPAGDNLPGPQTSPTPRGQDPPCTWSGKTEGRHPPEPARGRTPTSSVHERTDSRGTHARTPTPQRLQAPEANTKGTPARGLSPLPRSPSPAKPRGLRQPPCGEADGASSQLRGPSPVKGSIKIPVRLPPARPPTPGRGFAGTASGGTSTELERGPLPLKAITGDLSGSRHEHCSVEEGQEDLKLDVQVTAEAGGPRGLGPQHWEGRGSPLPSGGTKEQGIHHCLEEEPSTNTKLLGVASARPQGAGSAVIPRSGVYVPSLGGWWPDPGGLYDKVIQELIQGPPPLLKVDLGAWKAAPPGSPTPAVTVGPGSLKGKLRAQESGLRTAASPSAKGIRTEVQGGQACSAPTVSASLEPLTPSPSDPSSERAQACPGKGKRTLRKPQRIPSIYKLKLRPRIRPRRDHRPEKRPSRIPKPVTYLRLGPVRAPPKGRLVRAALGSKGVEATLLDGALAGEEEDREERKEPAIPLESDSLPLEGQGPWCLDPVPLSPEEESWV